MTAALLVFFATYLSVFTLGLQSLNVNQGQYLAAGVTSFFISTGHIFLYSYMPNPSGFTLVGYYLGGIAGITSSIWFHKTARRWWAGYKQRQQQLLCARCGYNRAKGKGCLRADCPILANDTH